MPVNTRIALDPGPEVRIADPLEQFAKVQGARNMILNAQAHQQNLQLNAEKLKQEQIQSVEAERAQKDNSTFQGAWQEAGGDLRKARELAVSRGVRSGYITKLDDEINKQAEQLAKTDKEKITAAQAKTDYLHEAISSIATETDPARQGMLWDAKQQEAIRAGVLAPNEAQPYQGPATVQDALARVTTQKHILTAAEEKRKQAGEQRAIETQAVELTGKRTDQAIKARQDAAAQLATATTPEQYGQMLEELPHGVATRFPPAAQFDPKATPALVRKLGMTAEQQAQAEVQATTRAETVRHNRVEEGQGAIRVSQGAQANRIRAAEADPYGMLGINPNPIRGGAAAEVHGDEFLSTLPTTLASKVKAVTEGRSPLPNARGGQLRGEGKAISDAVYQYDPNFSTQRADIRKAFTTGKQADNIGALNTAIVHLGRLGDTAEALNNGTFTPKNEMFNYFKDKFGSSTVSNFELLKDAVAGEMAAALKGNATDIEIANMKKSIRASNSPEQMRGVVMEGMGILNDKANTYEERYRSQVPGDSWSPILPTAKAQLQKRGIGKETKPAGGSRIKILKVE